MRKIIVLLLCVVMVLGVFTGCRTSIDNNDDSSQETETTTSTASSDTTDARLVPDVPEITFNGYQFRILTKGKTSSTWYSVDIDAESMTGEPINDAVYARNSKIEELYDIEIIEESPSSPDVAATTALTAQNDFYDMIALRMNDHMEGLINKGFMKDLNEVEYLDLTRPYYDQKSISELSIDGKNFAITGDLLTMDNDATRCVLFNKTIADDIGIETIYNADFYQLVESGKWTLDVLYECAKLAVQDKDGQAGMNPDVDIYGMETEPFNSLVMLNSAGVRIVQKNEEDIPVYSLYTDKAIEVLQKIIPIQNDACMMLSTNYSGYTDVWTGLFHPTFTSNRSLFYMGQIQNAKMFRTFDVDFGILPIPKYDESQEEYLSPVTTYGTDCISIPKIASNLERTAIIIEALSCESKYTVQPAYYEATLKGKTAKDEESTVMLDLMFANRTFDLGYMYNWGGSYDAIYALTKTNSTSITSTLKSIQVTAEREIAATVSAIMNQQ